MAYCICCQNEVDIIARLTSHAGLADVNPIELQTVVSQFAWQRYQLALETWDIQEADFDVCYRCYVFSGAERYYPFSMCPQFRY